MYKIKSLTFLQKMKNRNIITTKIIILLSIFSFLSCGFKPLYKQEINSINFQNISIKGDKKIAYEIKNNLMIISKKNSEKKYNAELKIKKNKDIKIKDKSGKVTRYNLTISINLVLTKSSDKTKITKTFIRGSDYDVAKIYSDTINNENNSIKNIIRQLSDDIISFVSLTAID